MNNDAITHLVRLEHLIALAFWCMAWNVAAADEVSFTHDVRPILMRSCAGCHRPEKLKGKLDVTTYAALKHGGKSGPAYVAGDSAASELIKQITGGDAPMPKNGKKLLTTEVSVLARWVAQGAKDDSATSTVPDFAAARAPDAYMLPPVISAIAASPDGKLLAIGGCHEILFQRADGSGLESRVASASEHIYSIVYSANGQTLVAAGGSAGECGTIDVYDAVTLKRRNSFVISSDTLFGMSVSPAGDRAAVGCADKSTRIIDLASGAEADRFLPATDWVLATCFSQNGSRVVAGGRDKSGWILDLETHHPFDRINDPTEQILCLARDPQKDVVIAGLATGQVKAYRLFDLIKTTERDRDPNRLKELERLPGPASAVLYSNDGKLIAVAGGSEVRVFENNDNYRRKSICAGAAGGVFAVAFSPNDSTVFAAGFDGQVRAWSCDKGKLLRTIQPFPTK